MMKVFLERGEGKALVPKVASTFCFNITEKKGGPVKRSYAINLKTDAGSVSF